MSLESTINDCKKLIEMDAVDAFGYEDAVIFSLFSSLNEKAKTINVLNKARQYSDCGIILRSFIEQVAYLNYILDNNLKNRAQLYLIYQNYNDNLKFKKHIESPEVKKCEVDRLKKSIDEKIKNNKGKSNSFEEQFRYIEKKYIELLPNGAKPDKTMWYSVENKQKNGINSVKDLMERLDMLPVYLGLYATTSNEVHGSDATRHLRIMNDTEVSYVVCTVDDQIKLVNDFLGKMFIDIATHYRLMKNDTIKNIVNKIKLNAGLHLKGF